MSRVSVSRVTNLEQQTKEVEQRQEEFSKAIAPRLGNEEYITSGDTKPGDWYKYPDHDPDFQEELKKVRGDKEVKDADYNFTLYVFDDTYLNMEFTLPHKESQSWAKVTKRLRDANGLPIGKAN